MSKHLGDYDASTVVYGKFTTFRPTTGAPFTLAGTPALSVYKDNSTTESVAGVTLTADFDSRTGLNHYAIDTSADGTFYGAGSFFDVVVTAGTVDGVSMVGAVVASFTLRKSSGLKPATAGRTLVVDAAGLADANVVKLGPTGSGTAQTARDVGANIDAAVSTRLATSGYTAPPSAAAVSVAVVDQTLSGHTASGTVGEALTNASSAGDPWATPLPGSYGAGTAGKIIGDNVNAPVGSVPTADANAVALLDKSLSGHTTAGTAGAALNDAASAGDPWATTVPGAYGVGTAGYKVGNALDATVSSRLATSGYTAPPSANDNADALLDRSAGVETNRTLRQALRLVLAALSGKLSGAATTTVIVRDTNDTKDRITATVDSNGNRTTVTYDAS